MYLAGWITCPHCRHRWQLCVEAANAPSPEQCIVVQCPNDNSSHRFRLTVLKPVKECPTGLTPWRLEDLEPRARPTHPWWRFWEWGEA